MERLKVLVPPRKRSAFVAEALQERLEEEETLVVLEETAGIVPDAIIAATALQHGLTLVTFNPGDFDPLGLQLYPLDLLP